LGHHAAAIARPIDALEIVRRDLAGVGFANVAYVHNIQFADQLRFPEEENIIGTIVHPDHHRMCSGMEPTPALREAGLTGGGGYLRSDRRRTLTS